MICARCGRASAEGASFCWNCGTPLRAGTAVPGTPEPQPATEPVVVVPAAPWPRPSAVGAAASGTEAGSSAGEPWRAPEGPQPPPSPWPPAGAEPPHDPWTPGMSTPTPHEPWTAPPGDRTSGPFAPPAPGAAPAALVYAGFWRRFWAAWLDGMILWALSVPFLIIWIVPHVTGNPSIESWGDAEWFSWTSDLMLCFLATTVVEMIYFAAFESSKHRATLGRIVLDLQVTDLHGHRISFWRALGRRLARVLSSFLFGLGFLVMLFHSRKQTLHDLIAGTLVVRRSTP